MPLDFSEPSDAALRQAVRFAKQFRGEITLLHVVQPAVAPYPEVIPCLDLTDDELQNAERSLRGMAARALLKSCPVQTVVRTGLAAHETWKRPANSIPT